MSAKILVVDDEPAIVYALQTLLSREGFYVLTTSDGIKAIEILKKEEFDLLLTDIQMEPVNGFEVMDTALKLYPFIAIVTITGYGSVDTALEAMRHGAFDYVTKPFRFDALIKTVRHALLESQERQSGAAKSITNEPRYYYRQLVGDSSAMRRIYQIVENVADSTQPIVVIGESGVGKTMLAWVIHCGSGRRKQKYVQLDCGSSNSWLQDRIVKQDIFLDTQGGSLLLENIHKLDREMQQLLLKYMQARQFVLDSKDEKVPRNTRLLLSSEKDLRLMVQRGEFLEELYYQFAAVPIDLPPLRDRPEDLLLLAQHFLNQFEKKEEVSVSLGPGVIQAIEMYSWPGNLTELRDVLFLAARAQKGGQIELDDLPTALRQLKGTSADGVQTCIHRWKSLRNFLKSKEDEYAKHLLNVTGNDLERVAEILEVDVEELKKLKEQ